MLPRTLQATRVVLLVLFGCSVREAEPPAQVDVADSPFPPSGMYEVSVRVLADDCTPAYAAPPPWRARVLTQAEGGKGRVNLMMPPMPPDSGGPSSPRFDFLFEPGYDVRHLEQPCPGFAIDSSYTLQATSTAGFELATAIEYGDKGSCVVVGPAKCKSEIEYVYDLVARECAAECTRGQRPLERSPTGGVIEWGVDCRCSPTGAGAD